MNPDLLSPAQYNLSHKINLFLAWETPDTNGQFSIQLTYDQVYVLQSLTPNKQGQFVRGGKVYPYTLDTSIGAGRLTASPILDVPDQAYRITAPELGRQRNALRVEVVPPSDRCWLRPRNERAQWYLDNRFGLISTIYHEFGYCVRESCKTCPIAMHHANN